MEIVRLDSIGELKSFYRSVYQNDPNFKDNKSSLLPLVCGQRSSFRKSSRQEMLAVAADGKRLCQCVLIHHKNSGGIANIAFFEALPDSHEAVTLLLEYARKWAVDEGCNRIVAGMDGHLNYSLGFSLSNNAPPSFGESYNPGYYADYFTGFSEVGLSSFYGDAVLAHQRIESDCASILSNRTRYSLESAKIDRRNLKRYTGLSNAIFEGHDFYFQRTNEEDYELFSQMALILDSGALLFIKDGEKDIGLAFYYPDFNELVLPGHRFGAASAVKRYLRFQPEKVKMVLIGVLPEYQNKGIVALAFQSAINTALTNYPSVKTIVSSWIVDRNTKSILFTKRYTKHKGGSFVVYVQDITASF